MFSQPLASLSKPRAMSNSDEMRPSTMTMAARRRVDAGQQFQHRALAGAVVADETDAVALVDAQVDVLQGAHFHDRVPRRQKHALEDEILEPNAPLLTDAEGQVRHAPARFGP